MANEFDHESKYRKVAGYRVIKDNKLRAFGETDDRKRTIRINEKDSLKKGGRKELRDTILHEKLHAEREASGRKNTEKIVYKETKKKLKSMSEQEKKKLDNLIK